MLGEGILKGLKETAKNALGSFVSEERLITVEYPEERQPLPEASRNFPFLVYDGSDWESGLRCVACQICEKECPPKCIYIEKSKDKKPDAVGKAQFYPTRFDIDVSVCMSCQICVEVCPFEAIKMNTEFELSTDDRFGGLLLDRKQLACSNEYYHQIHPTEAAEVDGRLAQERAAAEAKAKAAAPKAATPADAGPAAKPAAPAVKAPEAKPQAAAPAAKPSAVPASEISAGPAGANPNGTPAAAATKPSAEAKAEARADAPKDTKEGEAS